MSDQPVGEWVPVETKNCIVCGKSGQVIVKFSDLQAWKSGVHAQDAFPYLSADDREKLISGTCSKCWDELFGDDN